MTEHDLHKIATDQTRDAITRWIDEEEEMIEDGVSSALDFLSDSDAMEVIAIVRGRLLHVEPDYDKHYALLRQWSKSITRQEARILLDNSLGIGGDE